MEKIIIMGGGVAGLTCLNALLDRGMTAVLLEGGQIGSPKMCGEFIAPGARDILEKWQIGPTQSIHQLDFYAQKKKLSIRLPKAALAFSRADAERQLAARAKKLGATILENTFVSHIEPKSGEYPFIFTLNNNEKIIADTAFFATGRFSQARVALPYLGIKFHIPQVTYPDCLSMFSFEDAYFGVVPINNKQSNYAGLIRDSKLKIGQGKSYLLNLIEQEPQIKRFFTSICWDEIQFFEGRAPEFGMKVNPSWPDAYWVGDALAGLHPAIGSGFAHSIQSALCAVECYVAKESGRYHRSMRKKIMAKLRRGKLLHNILLKPPLAKWCMLFAPYVLNNFLKKLEYL